MRRATLVAELVGGRLLLSAEALAAAGLARLETCALLRRGDDLWLIPLRGAMHGGLLLKQRNARGDRVVEAAEVWHREGLDPPQRCTLCFTWREEQAAFVAVGVFCNHRKRN